jgi:Flp pilus assembly protein TadB
MLASRRLTDTYLRPVPPRFAVRVLALRRLGGTDSSRRLEFGRFTQRHKTEPVAHGAAFLDLVDRHVRLGSSVRGAIQSAASECDASLDEPLRVLLLHCRTGAPLDDGEVLDDAARRPTDDAFLIRSLVAAGAGGQAASFCLQRAAWALRERHAIRSERRAHAAQAVFAARVLSWLPVVFGIVMATTNASVRSAYFGGPIGVVCVLGGVGLNVLGRRWMRRITCSFG